jgi:Tfp pilus assembly protein PilX
MLISKQRQHSVILVILVCKHMVHASRPLRGSVLVLSLLVLAMLLSAALSGAVAVITTKNSSRVTEKSSLSFETADGAIENILKRVHQDNDSNLNDLADNLFGSASCSNGVISGTLPSSASGTYAVTFLDNNGAKLQCSGAGYNTNALWRAKLVKLRSVGNYGGSTRVMEVGVAQP